MIRGYIFNINPFVVEVRSAEKQKSTDRLFRCRLLIAHNIM